jgi:probable F420-dependent oxidoreductase
MKYGVSIIPTEYTMSVHQFAIAAEERGFESVFIPEHTHFPTSRRTRPPLSGEVPREYMHMVDPFAALAAAAAVTNRVKLGTGICLVTQRDPIILAKEVATVDLISNGRFVLGIGAGWNVEEAENHGVVFKTRWRLLGERVAAMKAIWTTDPAEYHGQFVNFDPIWCFPKPVQKPYPPILLGGHDTSSLQRVVDYCDGWIPSHNMVKDFFASLAELRRRAEAAGRDPMSIAVTSFWASRDRALLDRYEAAGVERVVFKLPSEGADQVLPKLDSYAGFLK